MRENEDDSELKSLLFYYNSSWVVHNKTAHNKNIDHMEVLYMSAASRRAVLLSSLCLCEGNSQAIPETFGGS